MSEVTINKNNILNGVVIMGKFEDVDKTCKKIYHKINAELDKNFETIEVTPEFLKTLDKLKTFQLLKPEKSRKYTVLDLTQFDFKKQEAEVIELILEKRVLKAVIIFKISELHKLSDEMMDAVFGNFGNFVIGRISHADQAILKIRMPDL